MFHPDTVKRLLTCMSATILIALTAGLLAPYGELFWPNFAIYLLPSVAIVAVIAACGAYASVAYGVASALCAFLLGYYMWLQSHSARDAALLWLGFYGSLPGAVIGGYVAHIWVRSRSLPTAVEYVASFAWTVLGLALNLGVLALESE